MTNLVIVTRDRLRLITQTINSLYAHTPHDRFNVVIIDDDSRDFRAKAFLRRQAILHPNLSLLEIDNSGHTLSRLKNIGVTWSEQRWGRGDWLCLADNDVYFMEGWLRQMIQATNVCDDDVLLFGGQCHPYHHAEVTQINGMTDPVDKADRFRVDSHGMLDGPHWFMPWSTWDAHGPLRGNTPGVCKGEDVDFCKSITDAGGRIGVTVPHCVLHTGLTNSNGDPAPGYDARMKMKVEGVYYE